MGEIFKLDELGRVCAEDGVYDFLFVAPALPITGAVGSPLNPIATYWMRALRRRRWRLGAAIICWCARGRWSGAWPRRRGNQCGRNRIPPLSTIRLPGPRLADFPSLPGLAGFAMDLFTQLFASLLAFVYHCFDRIVIYGYLSGLSRPERVVNFFHQIVGVPVVSREILSQRTADYQNWVEAFARNHRIPIEWAEKGVRKEDHVLPWQRRMVRA